MRFLRVTSLRGKGSKSDDGESGDIGGSLGLADFHRSLAEIGGLPISRRDEFVSSINIEHSKYGTA
jgi:hypothetical protein